MRYVYENYVFVNDNNKGVLYKDGKIMFMGNAWSAITIFLNSTNHAPEVCQLFQAQLDQRQQLRFKAEQKKPKEPAVPIPEKPKKPVVRRPGIDRRFV